MFYNLFSAYLYPTSKTYRFFEWLNRYALRTALGLSAAILAYPIGNSLYQFHQHDLQQQVWADLHLEIARQSQLKSTLLHLQQQQNRQPLITEINQTLKQLAEQHHAQINQIEWQFTQPPKITFVISQQTEPILQIIRQITQQTTLQFQEIRLIKLNENRLIQLNALLSLTQETK